MNPQYPIAASVPVRVFGQDDFPLGGEGGTPKSAKENSAKKQVFQVQKLHFKPFFIHF